MTNAASIAPPFAGLPGLHLPEPQLAERLTAGVARLRRTARDASVAACLVGLAGVAYAEIALQDWIPDMLEIPADAEVVTDREIGSSVRLFAFSTNVETGPMLADWEETLRSNGFAIQSETDELVDDSIEFSGPGIANAKIVANREDPDGQTIVEFDATLN